MFKIESNVPESPKYRSSKQAEFDTLFDSMKPNDSFLIDPVIASLNTVRYYAERHAIKKESKFSFRKDGETMRVRRIK